jgi:broad specificity phosphatase PhoE
MLATARAPSARHAHRCDSRCIIGLPERGKPYIARRLQSYLSYFHGAEVHVYNLSDYQKGEPGCDENADLLLADLRKFMTKENHAAGSNMSVVKTTQADEGDVPPSLLVDDKDPRRKNVDSGKVAIIMSTDSHASFKEKWAGTSKERRQWASATLAMDCQINAKLIFIEVIVNQPHLIEANIRAKRRAFEQGETSLEALREHNRRVKLYSRMYVTLQDDGSEDDLSYIKLYNYGGKVVTNRMHGYLRMRIAQFLTTVHTTPHVIYLSRHGQSEYNVLGKIGGNPPLSVPGAEYAQRLGAWVPEHIQQKDGRPVKARLWTSSLQRTILTAEHIPHPIIPIRDFGQCESIEGAPIQGGMPVSEADGSAATATSKKPSSLSASPLLGSPDSPLLGHDRFTSGVSPPPELRDPDSEGSWEQMSPRVYRNLDEIFAGEYEGMRYEDIKRLNPDEATLRAMDKIGYRYPRGESYFDILSRLDPLVHEMESYHEPLLIVSHQATLRVLYAYLMGKPRSSAPKIEIPLHTVMKITYDGWNPPSEERFHLGPDPLPITHPTADKDDTDGQKHL